MGAGSGGQLGVWGLVGTECVPTRGNSTGLPTSTGNLGKNHSSMPLPKQRQVIGMAVYPCRKVPQEDMVRGVLVLESDRLSFENATAITPL